MDWTPEQIDRCAAAAHYAYESAALDAGWETNPASRVPWNDVPASNKAATRAAAAAVLSAVDLSDHDRAVARAAQPRPDHDYCAWCGWSRERDDSDVDHLRAHVMECPEHPLRLGSDSRDQAVAADALRQAADSLDNLRDPNEYDDPYVRGITRAFHRGIDRSQERLRARAEGQVPDGG